MALFSFNKTGYNSSDQIASQYDKKVKYLLRGRDESELSKQEQNRLALISSLKDLDPRLKGVCFGLEEEATIGIDIADKLDSMTDEEFIESSYSFEWIDELKQKTVCRVTDQETLNLIEEQYNA